MKKKVSKLASPKVRKFARQLGANIIEIQGSQRSGRVSEKDVKDFIKKQFSDVQTKEDKEFSKNEYNLDEFGKIEVKDLPRIKKISSKQLVKSWTEIPHVTQHDQIDITEMEDFRNSLRDLYTGERISVTPLAFIMKAVVNALKTFPNFNASLDSENNNCLLYTSPSPRDATLSRVAGCA